MSTFRKPAALPHLCPACRGVHSDPNPDPNLPPCETCAGKGFLRQPSPYALIASEFKALGKVGPVMMIGETTVDRILGNVPKGFPTVVYNEDGYPAEFVLMDANGTVIETYWKQK